MDRGNFRAKTISGLKWNFISKVIVQSVSIIIAIILSRLLLPKDFGLIAMVNVLIGFLNVFQHFGLGSALIQKKDINQADKSTVFWLNTLIGLIITILIILASPFIATFYGIPALRIITICLSLNFFLGALNVVQLSLLTKHLDFKKLFYIRFITILIAGGIAVMLALNNYGVWSLVAQSIVSVFVMTFLLWIISSWRPTLIWDKLALRELMKFSFPLLGNKTLNYWVRNLDKILVGRLFGDQDLGFYNKGYSLMLMPLKNITSSVSDVMFPSLSIINKDKIQVREVFLKMVRVLALVTFPIMLGVSIMAESIILVVLGDNWAGTIPIIKILAIVGMIQSISRLYSVLYLSQGATGLQFRLGLILKAQTIIWILIGLKWGIQGVATTYLIAVACNQIPHIYFSGGLVGIKIKAFFLNLVPVLLISLLVSALIFFLDRFFLNTSSHILRLVTTFITGSLSYLFFIKIFQLSAYKEAMKILKEMKA